MADFDQLIKDKMEKAQYAYRPSAWRSFAKSAGVRAGLSGLQIAAITVGVVAVVTGITLGIVFSGRPAPNSEQGTVVRVQDTVETQHAAAPVHDNDEQIAVETCHGASQTQDNNKVQAPVETQHAASLSRDKNKGHVSADTQPAASQIQNPAPQPNANRQRPAYGRPLEILVDTITQMEPTDEQLRKGNSRIF